LAGFVKLTPIVLSLLDEIAGYVNIEKDKLQSLKGMKKLLKSIGYNKLAPVINCILDTNEKGNAELLATWARKLSDDLKKLHNRVLSASRTNNAVYSDSMDNVNYLEAYGAQSLKVILEQIENGDATRKLRILAVDDASVMLKTIHAALNAEYKVYTLADPAKVEKFLHQVTPELFLLDYKMPGLSGFDLIPIIRSFEEHKDTPIIFLTSMGTSDNVSAAAMLGAVDFIVKPFHGNVLREKVAKYIVKKKLF
jgi:PleD family two-component response regulator